MMRLALPKIGARVYLNKPLSALTNELSLRSLSTLSYNVKNLQNKSLVSAQKAYFHDEGRGYGGGRGTDYGSGRGSNYGGGRDNYGNRPRGGSYSNSGNMGRRSDGFSDLGSTLPKQTFENLQPIKKNSYQEPESVANRPQSEIDNYFAENRVSLIGNGTVRPIMSFEETTFPDPIKQKLFAYPEPSIIQAVSWPLALSGRDIISIAKTGSGKTLGFILPAIMHIQSQTPRQRGDGPTVLVVAPTRELAMQVESVAREFGSLLGLRTACLYGGAPKPPQGQKLRMGVDICVATPGRLADFLSEGVTNLLRCSYLVLDEADRMLDMGFEPQIRKIISQIRPDRQTLMFSATWPKEVRELARDFQTDAIRLNVGSGELAANPNITQHVMVVNEYEKQKRLQDMIKQFQTEEDYKALIFVKTKRSADALVIQMRQNGIQALSIHGDKSQGEREWALAQLRAGEAKLIICTDVFARGLDVSDIKYVINYDYPNDAEDYVHRIGRTGRGNNTGTSYTFFSHDDYDKAADLIKVLQQTNQDVPDALMQMVPQKRSVAQSQKRYAR
ncbi:DEAD/DEAH box helicase domain-containing protein [Ditylenchus destructor]|uniref:RNA helicase n=1 Tax=Ditylenchus destructor TaxID=166010 RepID=A0AAD4NBC4_9BILA|nr:DEAD/DEAH box helicase domain-containing protein [Ditylenchus destructor]